MANWTSGILTNRGRDLQLKVEAGEKLKMTRFKLGDGMETTAEAADLNDLIGAKIAFGITGIERLGTLCKFTGVVTNTAVSAGFRAREWGLFAEDPDLGEILYMIALDDRPDYIAAQDAVLNSTITYALNVDISQASKIEPIIDPQGLVTTEILEKAAGLVRRNMEYFLNDKVFDIQLSAHPSWRLVCTKAGTTSGVLLNLHGAKLGDTYADGTAEWTVKDAYEATVDAHNKAPDAHADIRRILDDKAPIASPALTGTPTVPMATKGTSTDQIASTAFVAQAVADAVLAIGGHETPTITALINWELMATENNGVDARNLQNSESGVIACGGDNASKSGYGKGCILLKQVYTDFDRILVLGCDDACSFCTRRVFDKWELDLMFANSLTFNIINDNGIVWRIFGGKKGTYAGELSSGKVWRTHSQGCGIIEIYGIKY